MYFNIWGNSIRSILGEGKKKKLNCSVQFWNALAENRLLLTYLMKVVIWWFKQLEGCGVEIFLTPATVPQHIDLEICISNKPFSRRRTGGFVQHSRNPPETLSARHPFHNPVINWRSLWFVNKGLWLSLYIKFMRWVILWNHYPSWNSRSSEN